MTAKKESDARASRVGRPLPTAKELARAIERLDVALSKRREQMKRQQQTSPGLLKKSFSR